MGMILSLMRISEEDLNNYLKDSTLLEKDFYADHSLEEELKLIDLDKSWDGILYLLNGEGMAGAGEGLSCLLLSGQLVDKEQDLGYGPAHYLTPIEVQQYYQELSNWTTQDLQNRFDPEDMTARGIYPSIQWDASELEYLMVNVSLMQEFYAKAAAEGEAVISVIS